MALQAPFGGCRWGLPGWWRGGAVAWGEAPGEAAAGRSGAGARAAARAAGRASPAPSAAGLAAAAAGAAAVGFVAVVTATKFDLLNAVINIHSHLCS